MQLLPEASVDAEVIWLLFARSSGSLSQRSSPGRQCSWEEMGNLWDNLESVLQRHLLTDAGAQAGG